MKAPPAEMWCCGLEGSCECEYLYKHCTSLCEYILFVNMCKSLSISVNSGWVVGPYRLSVNKGFGCLNKNTPRRRQACSTRLNVNYILVCPVITNTRHLLICISPGWIFHAALLAFKLHIQILPPVLRVNMLGVALLRVLRYVCYGKSWDMGRCATVKR